MQGNGCGEARYPLLCARSNLLAVCAFCWLVGALTGAWALDVADGVVLSATPQSLLTHESLAAATHGESASADCLLEETPILGGLQLSLGKTQQLRLNAFSYAGKTSPRALGLNSAFGLWTGALPQGPVGRSLGLTPTAAAGDDRAASLKAEYGGGPAKLSVNFSDVGAKFPDAAAALHGTDPASLGALKTQAGLRSMNLNGALQLGPRLSLTSTSTSLTNNKPGDEKRGLTTTDWANTLALSLGQHSTVKLSLTDHSETWDPAAGKTDLSRRTSQATWDTSFGRGALSSLKLGLTDVSTTQGGPDQSERTEELHLVLAPLARLKLSADQVAKDGVEGNTQTTSAYGAVMQLAPGAELAANLKTTSPEGAAETQERYLKLAARLGGGASALALLGEQKLTQTAGSAMIEEAKYDVTGGLGRGPGRVNLRALLQRKCTEGTDGPVEGTALLHLDRAFGPRVKLLVDREHVVKGTNGQPDETSTLKLGLAADLDSKTKLVAGVSSLQNATTGPQNTRDLALERRLAQLLLRAEDHQRTSVEQTSTRNYAADLPMGKLPNWAADMGRKHEFGEIYEFLVTKEAAWLDLPFAGLRYLRTQRRHGPDDGVDTTIVSYRAMLAKRYHLQVTYHDRPEYEGGDNKGRPMELTRRHAGLGAPVARGLFARGWVTLENKATDALSARSTLGLGLCGKVHGDGRMEVNYAQDRGQWEGQVVARDSLALMYAHRVSEENQVALKVGYAWGQNLGNGRSADCRVSIQYSTPV